MTTTTAPPSTAAETRVGATYLGENRTAFRLWAPFAQRAELHVVAPAERTVPMMPAERGYYAVTLDDAPPGTRYFYRLDSKDDRPDPASRFQPEGVHGPSAVVDSHAFQWTDAGWQNPALSDYVIYELHVGAFTPEGTFEAIIPRLASLADLGVTAIELMPVAQFPGARNWGYDGVQLYATQASYGGPEELRRLVDATHAAGIAIILDVVYNHLGPEGNYLAEFGPYFTDRYHTPWGTALNYDGPQSDEVRRFFIGNAMQWLEDFHIDALRLDAVHAILDFSAFPFLEELAATAEARGRALGGRRWYLIGETDQNDSRVIRPRAEHGLGLDGHWSDDFHHTLHVLLTDEHGGYYADFGTVSQLATAYRRSYIFAGEYAPSRLRRHGNAPDGTRYEQFVVCAQNHDQVGNRAIGDRLSSLISFEGRKLAAAALLLSPSVPLLFMGEEYGDDAPFQYFVSHGDYDLIEAVRNGRVQEFAGFAWNVAVPDPQAEETFLRSKLTYDARTAEGEHKTLWQWYQALIRLRKTLPPLGTVPSPDLDVQADDGQGTLTMVRGAGADRIFIALNFGKNAAAVTMPGGHWRRELDSADARWGGPGSDLPETCDGGIIIQAPSLSATIWRA